MTEVLDYAPGELTSPERLVLIVLAEAAHDATRECWPGMETLTRRTGLSERHVRRALADLAAHGCDVRVAVGVDKRGWPMFANKGHRSRYRLPDLRRRTPVTPLDPHQRRTPMAPCSESKAAESGTQRRPRSPSKEVTSDRRFLKPKEEPKQEPKKAVGGGGGHTPARPREATTTTATVAAELPTDPGPEPHRRCRDHLNCDTSPACTACKDARLHWEWWKKASDHWTADPEPLPAECGQCDAQPGDPPSARMIYVDGNWRKCPWCHPEYTAIWHQLSYATPAQRRALETTIGLLEKEDLLP